MGSISDLSNLQSLLNTAAQGTDVTTTTAMRNAITNPTISSVAPQDDSEDLSPLGQIMNTLNHLQQSSPASYQQLTGQIAAALHDDAQSAQSEGDSGTARQIEQLATDFSGISQTGQPPTAGQINQLLAAQQSAGTPVNPHNPMAIIFGTLANAGIPVTT